MSLISHDIKKIASLARIHVEESEYPVVQAQLATIFGWIDQLAAVDTTGVKPYRDLFEISTHEREDVITSGNQQEIILKNAPEKAHTMFAVPKVVE